LKHIRETLLSHRIANRNLPQLLLTARDRLMSHFRPILNHFGITEQQWRILRVLDEQGQLEPRELCEQCQILSPSMAGVLARMEEVRLISRERMATDQRRVIVRLTTTGDRLLREIAPLIAAQYEHIDAAYGREMLDNLYVALQEFMQVEQEPVPQVDLPPRTKTARVVKK
jgi:homoprotocatechuate degradation regulator HpaR